MSAVQFRQWATSVLRDFAIRSYVIDRQPMENGTFLGEDYFERLLDEIREIRLLPEGYRHLRHQHRLQQGLNDQHLA